MTDKGVQHMQDESKKTKKANSIPEQQIWQAKADEYLVGWKRAQADLENYRKRTEEDKAGLIKYAHANVILQILPVLDNFKRAAQHIPASDGNEQLKAWVEGVKSIEKQFEQVLQTIGVVEVTVKIGDAFDPAFHEALMQEDSDQPADTITGIIEPGYSLHGRLLRPVKVRVSKGT